MTIKGMEKRLRESFMYKNIFRPIKLKLWREPYYKFIKDPYRKYRESRYTDEEYFLRRHKNIFGLKQTPFLPPSLKTTTTHTPPLKRYNLSLNTPGGGG